MNQSEDVTAIERSKLKLTLLVLGSIAFVGIGIWILTQSPEDFQSSHRARDPGFMYLIGSATILFAGACLIVGLRKLFDPNPGIVLSPEGLTDRTGGAPNGFIPWAEITGLSRLEVASQKFVTVHLTDPTPYVTKGNFLQRMIKKGNMSRHGTPVQLSSNALRCSFSELEETVTDYFARYGNIPSE